MYQIKLYTSIDRRSEAAVNEFLQNNQNIKVLQVTPIQRGQAFVYDLLILYEKDIDSDAR